MNLLTFRASELESGNLIRVSGDRARYMFDVQGLSEGSIVRIGEIDGNQGVGRIVEICAESLVVRVENMPERCIRPRIDLILALPRPQMLKHVFQTVAMIGVDHLMLIRARRVEKSYFSSPVLEPEKVFYYLRLGLEQAVVTALPHVSIHKRFMKFVDDDYPGHEAEYFSKRQAVERLVAHPRAEAELSQVAVEEGLGTGQHLVLAIGPEGGWDDFEVEQFSRLGFLPFSNGTRILRVEQAVSGLLSQLSLLQQMNASESIGDDSMSSARLGFSPWALNRNE